MSQSEAFVLRDVMLHLGRYPGVLVHRNNVGFASDVRGQCVRFGVEGMPDVYAFHGGLAYGIECKSKTGRLRPAQVAFRSAFEGRAGCVYILARDVSDLYPWFPPTAT